MTTFDPIPAIEQLGYTPREAAFIYLVARNSGYFLARQFNWFLRRKMGHLTQAFTDKLRDRGHGSALDYGQSRFVYHIKSKTIYRLLGVENSQNRRVKGDHEIRLRLMILDYLLEHLDARVLSTEAEKVEFFLAQSGIEMADLPATVFASTAEQSAPTVRYFVDRFPIIHTDGQIHFAYFDEGAFTLKPFSAYLDRYRPVLLKLPAFALDYVALNASNFLAATKEFKCRFPQGQGQRCRLIPRGADHLVEFFQAQRLWDEDSSDFRPQHLALLREGERIYNAPEHSALKLAWLSGHHAFEKRLEEITGVRSVNASFRTSVLDQSYPIFGYKNSGSWQGNHDSVLDSAPDSV